MIKSLYQKYKEQINYVIVGCCTTLISLISYYACVLTFLDPTNPIQLQVANVISWVLAVAFAFFTNRKYVFESQGTDVFQEAVKFVGSRVTTLIIDMACMALFVSVCHFNDKIAKFAVQFIVFILNYLFSKFFVFKKEKED